ncbi:hypothetical protein [Elizabethkingia anophelis]|uniref:hypothetical protein n=1 Tax=Elizabethkingia anophelis TaxID=1117645 RepID=UPI0038922032
MANILFPLRSLLFLLSTERKPSLPPAICDEFLLYYNVIGSYLKTPYYAVVKEYFKS